jgi:hypothetical protein
MAGPISANAGVAVHQGWFALAVVSGRRVWTFHVSTRRENDRLSAEPYHVAGGWQGLQRVPVPGAPEALVREGLKIQRRETLKNLRACTEQLSRESVTLARLAVLCGKGRMPDELSKILSAHSLIHVAEGEAVRNSVREACRRLGVEPVDVDRREIESTTSEARLERANDGPWRKEERLCASAASTL